MKFAKNCSLPRTLLVMSSLSLMAACSSFGNFDVTDRVDYKGSKSINSLEVPPDLSSPNYDTTYANIPGGGVSASALARGEGQGDSRAVLPSNAGIKMMRDGNVRWVQIAAPAEVIWPRLQGFWRSLGIGVRRDEPRVGIMETEWAENRAEIPLDPIRKSFGKAFSGMFDAGSRDRFKVRLERPSQQVTNVYISHERAEEYVSGTGSKWQYAPSRPELEAEMLNRLMVFLQGGDPAQQSEAVAEARQTSVPVSMTRLEGGQPALLVDGSANAVWIRTGVMLGRAGLSIEQQKRNQGVYLVTYEKEDGQKKQGFFSRVFNTERDMLKVGSQYQVQIADAGNRSIITVGDGEGDPLKPAVAQSLLERLKSEFER